MLRVTQVVAGLGPQGAEAGRNVEYEYAALQRPKFGGWMPLFALADFAQRQDRVAVTSSHRIRRTEHGGAPDQNPSYLRSRNSVEIRINIA